MVKGYSGADRALAYLFNNATEVSFTQIQTSGTPIGTITIDGVSATIYQQARVGNVKDVLVDGVSVVDANGDAQLNSAAFGTYVEANPSGSPTDALNKVQIGQTIYSLPEGGSTQPIVPTEEYATSERNSTAQATYSATDDMYAIAINLSVNGEASNYVQTCSITTDGEILDHMTNARDSYSAPNRNYAVSVDALNLANGDDVVFTNTGTATYIVRLRGVVGLNQEVRLKSEVSNVITADNNNNSRTVSLSSDKVYMVLAFSINGTGGSAGTVSVSSSDGTLTYDTLEAQSVKLICSFVVGGSNVTISFGNETNYCSKGHIIYEVGIQSSKYVTENELKSFIVANPVETATEDINAIKIDDTVYEIPQKEITVSNGIVSLT